MRDFVLEGQCMADTITTENLTGTSWSLPKLAGEKQHLPKNLLKTKCLET